MRPVSEGFERTLVAGSQTRIAQLSLLDANLETVQVLTGPFGVTLDGSVSIDSERRRSCSVTIANPDGVWTPAGPSDPLFPNRLIRLERGLMVDGVPELVSLGVFMIDRPVIHVGPAGSTISISAQDRVKLSLKSKFTVPTTYEQGLPIAEVVRAIATDAGMGTTLYRLEDGGKTLAADRTFVTGDDRWPSIVQVAADFALIAYVDADGILVLEAAPTPDTLPAPSWSFAAGADAIMLGLTKSFNDDQLYNHELVSGESSNLPPVAAEVRDLNPSSPAYNPVEGTGPIGDRLDVYTSPMIRSIEQALEVALVRLLRNALIEEAIELPSIVHPALEGGDAIAIVNEISRTADTYLIDTLTIPLGEGSMLTTSRKLRDLRALG